MAERLYTQVDLLALFGDIERAVRNHGKFKTLQEPEFKMTRLGCTFVVKVKLVGSRKRRPDVISGSGDSPWAAAEVLIKGLDHWAIACR